MKEMKRILSLVLALVMIVGVLPATALAAESPTQYLVFATDRHGSTSAITEVLTTIENNIDGDVEYLGLGGDMVSNGSYTNATILSEAQKGSPTLTAETVDITKGSHDGGAQNDLDMFHEASGWLYSGEDYHVYGIVQADMENATSAQSVAAAFQEEALAKNDGKVIIVLSHLPLHKYRNDNLGATYWDAALNTVAGGSDGVMDRDVIFLHGHNHSQDGGANYFYAVEQGFDLQGTSKSASASTTNYYTYATAGYLKENGQASLVTITDSTVNLTRYDSDGSSTTLATVTRAAQSSTETVTLESIAISGTTEYTVGDELALTVTATYSDTTTKDVTAEATLSGYDMSTAGTYTVTANYSGLTATAEIVVSADDEATETEKEVSYILAEGTTAYTVGDTLTFNVSVNYSDGTSETVTQDECELTMSSCSGHTTCADVETAMGTVACDMGAYHQVEVTYGGKSAMYTFTVGAAEDLSDAADGVTVSVSSGVVSSVTTAASTNAYVADAMAGKDITNYVAYDISPLVALKDGNYATVTLPVVKDAKDPVVYYVSDDGQTVEKVENATVADGYISFRTSHFSTWVSADGSSTTVDDGNTEVTVTTTTTEQTVTNAGGSVTKTVYVLADSVSSGSSYLIVNGNAAGSGYYALARSSSSVAATGVTIQSGSLIIDGTTSTETYIELDDATDELWTTGASLSSSTSGTLKNGNYYLRYNNNSLSLSTSNYTNWYYSSNRLYRSGNSTRYLRYNNGWTTTDKSSSASSVYFYVPVEATITNSVTYSVTASNLTKANPTSGDTLTISASTNASDSETASDFTYTKVADENEIISGISSAGVVSLTGEIGTATVKVSYKVTVNSVEYEIYKLITVTAKSTSSSTVTGTSGLNLYKTVDLTEDGTYDIQLSAFATGQKITTSTEQAKPADIVLVLDCSSSMNAAVSSSDTTMRYTALYNAVKSFASTVYEKSAAQDVNHRISIVTFYGSATTRLGLTDTDNETDQGTINGIIENLKTYATGDSGYYGSGTEPVNGLTLADGILDTAEAADGYDRSQVVILFTDGYPGAQSSVNASSAVNAINAAYALKQDNVSVYTVAMLGTSGVGPSESYDAGGSTVEQVNFYLHATSSNYPNAQASSTSSLSNVVLGDENTDETAYYQAASSGTDLTNIFTAISQGITNSSSTSVTLDEYSVMKDIIGSSFSVPFADATAEELKNYITIRVYGVSTEDGTSYEFDNERNTTIGDAVEYEVVPSTSGDGYDINITNFDYSAHYTAVGHDGYVLVVNITGIKVADDAHLNEAFATNGAGSGLYAAAEGDDGNIVTDSTATATFPQPQSVVTSKVYVLDYAKEVTLDESDWYSEGVNLNHHAYTAGSTYGTFSADDSIDDEGTITYGTYLKYAPQTMQWDGYDTATLVNQTTTAFSEAYPAAVASGTGANQNYFLTKVSVIPANNVYYEDSFVTSEATGTVGIEYGTGWSVVYDTKGTTTAPDGYSENTESAESDEDTTLGGVHGWIDSMNDDTTFSDGSAHVSSTSGSTAVFSFTGTGVDIYSYTDMKSGMIIGMLYEGEGIMDGDSYKVAQQTLMVDNLAVSGNYYQIPTLSFNGLTYGTYTVELFVSSAKAPQVDENGKVVTEDVYDDEGNPVLNKDGTTKQAIVYTTDKRSTYYLDGIRVYNPLGKTTNAYSGTEQTMTFTEVRDLMATDTTTASASVVYIDLDASGNVGIAKDYSLTEYGGNTVTAYGPENEVYIAAGDAIVFAVGAETTGVSYEYYVGLKSPTGNALSVDLNGSTVEVGHSTDQYYKVVPNSSGYISITSNSTTDILSVTKIQMIATETVAGASVASFSLRSITGDEAVAYAVASVEETVPEETVPEETVPEETVPEETVPEETVPEETVPEETVPDIKVEIDNKVNEFKKQLQSFVSKLFGSMSSWFGR